MSEYEKEYEEYLNKTLKEEKQRVVDNKYRVSWLSTGLWLHHDSKNLLEAISFAKANKTSVNQIIEKEVWFYEEYEKDQKQFPYLVSWNVPSGLGCFPRAMKCMEIEDAIKLAKEHRVSVYETTTTNKEVWSYRLYEELKAKVDSLVEEIGVGTALEILEASNKFKLGD